LSWDPVPAAALLLGIAGLILWLVLAPPARSARGVVRMAAALLLALALLDVGCQRAGAAGGPSLVVLVDRSLSMEAAGRESAAEAWVERLEELEGWRVEREPFGGTTTDLAAAIALAEARLPDAIAIVSDGRAAGGRAAEPPGIPLHVHAPEPIAIEDLAIVDVVVDEREEGGGVATVELAAVGGLDARAREVEVTVDGRRAGSEPAGPPLAAGERRTVRIELPVIPARAVVEARFMGEDAVAGNDRRARLVGPGPGPRGILLVALKPGWELGFVRRELETAGEGRVDAVWATAPGRLAPLDRGAAASWSALDAGRYRTVWLFGDPALLGEAGRAWVERFAALGSRGIAWLPAGYAGALPGVGAAAPGSAGGSGPPAATEAGLRWLATLGGPLDSAPRGEPGWPPLELLPAPVAPPAGASALLTVGERPVAWIRERGTSRALVLLGTGYYRWRLAPEAAPRAFWEGWIGALARWLAGASAADRPLVRMPSGARIAHGDTLALPVAEPGDVAWRVESQGGDVVARGTVESDAETRELRAGPFAPGVYRIVVEGEGDAPASRPRRTVEPFVVESWSPDLAWTAADTASLAAAARASGGTVVGSDARIPPPERGDESRDTSGRALGVGTTPWVYFVVTLLLLADWGLGRRRLARPQGTD
jgi:hypothetical protein